MPKKWTAYGKRAWPEYKAWKRIRHRCHNPKHMAYRYYGARGIAVCERWKGSFEAFFEDMGPRPSKDHSIDRFPDNDGNYEPGNCRWATRNQQMRNRRNTRWVTIAGETKCLTDWIESSELPSGTVSHRIYKLGWPIERALNEPLHTSMRR